MLPIALMEALSCQINLLQSFYLVDTARYKNNSLLDVSFLSIVSSAFSLNQAPPTFKTSSINDISFSVFMAVAKHSLERMPVEYVLIG